MYRPSIMHVTAEAEEYLRGFGIRLKNPRGG